MCDNLLLYMLYGLVAGFSEFTPISASAHQALFPQILNFNSNWAVLRLFVHAGALASLVFLSRPRLNHLLQEIKLVSLPPRQRKRPPDIEAVLDMRLMMMALLPVLLGTAFSPFIANANVSLLLLALLLLAGAALTYIPDHVPGGNRKTAQMSPLDGLLLGLCAGCSVVPGLSGVGLMLAVGLLRKCDREYLLDLVLLISGLMLAAVMLADFLAILVSGFAGLSLLRLLGCLLACAAAFGGGIGAILMMRFLAVKTGFFGFSFYGWGLGLFSFILYLMV